MTQHTCSFQCNQVGLTENIKGDRRKYELWLRGREEVYIIQVLPRKFPKFLDTRKLCCNIPKTQTKRPNLSVFRQNVANGIANREDPDQTAPLGPV